MRLSTKGRYSTRAMLDLAVHFGEGPIQTKDIAVRQRISTQYLGQLLIPLRQQGLVKGFRGFGGGIVLARKPEKILLSEIIRVAEGSLALVKRVDDPSQCSLSDQCINRHVWTEIERATIKILDSVSLQDLVELQRNENQRFIKV